jgi:hypothetical protein
MSNKTKLRGLILTLLALTLGGSCVGLAIWTGNWIDGQESFVWGETQRLNTIADYRYYMSRFPNGEHTADAKRQIALLTAQATAGTVISGTLAGGTVISGTRAGRGRTDARQAATMDASHEEIFRAGLILQGQSSEAREIPPGITHILVNAQDQPLHLLVAFDDGSSGFARSSVLGYWGFVAGELLADDFRGNHVKLQARPEKRDGEGPWWGDKIFNAKEGSINLVTPRCLVTLPADFVWLPVGSAHVHNTIDVQVNLTVVYPSPGSSGVFAMSGVFSNETGSYARKFQITVLPSADFGLRRRNKE